MRITDASIIGDFLSSITRSKARINRLNRQLAEQKRILRVSDDPAAAGTLLRLDADLERVNAYKAAITDGKGFLDMTAKGLGRMSDLLGEMKSALSGAFNTGDPSLLNRFADQLDAALSLGLEVANTQFDGRYLFGGTQTTAPPFVRAGVPQRVAYQGDAGALRFQVGDGVSQTVNVSGMAAFSSTGELNLGGLLDSAAAVNSVVSTTVQIADGTGAVHDVVLTMRKTDAHAWSISAALPPGSTGATLSGGSATLSFDPATGAVKELVRGTPLVLTPANAASGAAAPSTTVLLRTGSIAEGSAGGAGSSLSAAYQNVSVFNKLIELRDALRSGHAPSADDLAMMSVMQGVVMREEARAGSYITGLRDADDYLTAQRERLLDLRSATQDIDLAEIGLKLKQEQVMLDAALSAAANILPKSLVDFLK